MATEFEREIEEILRKLGDTPPKQSWGARLLNALRARWDGFISWLQSLPQGIAPDQLMITAILFIVAAWILRFAFPPAMPWVGLAGIGMFVAAYFLSFRRFFGGRSQQVRWRGQVINMRQGQPSLADRLIYWLRRRFRGY